MAISNHTEKQHVPMQALSMDALVVCKADIHNNNLLHCLGKGKMGKPSPYVVVLFYPTSCRNNVLAINCNNKRGAGEGRGWAKGLFLAEVLF